MRRLRNIQTQGNLDVIWGYSNMSVVSTFWNMLVWSFTTKTGLVALSSAVAAMGALILWARKTFVPEIEKSNFLDLRFLNTIPIPTGEDRPTDLIDTPPFPKEIQAISSMEIIKRYKLPIDKLIRESSLSESEINLYLLPAIEKLVHIVHLLPASHEDHHSYEGGLLTHSLETATNAVITAQNHIFDAGEMPGQKYQNKQRWILAAAIAGLAHDLGKVIRDIRVVDADTHRVKRMDVPMKNWIRRYQVRAYSINWTGDDRTPKSHQGDSHFMLRSLLSDSIVNYLCYEGSSTIYKALRDSVYDMCSGPLGKLLQEADIRSSSDDQVHRAQLSANNQIIQTSNASQICHAIQMMLTTGKWSYNKPDSRVFVTREGCFLLWSEDATGKNITAQEISEASREIAKDTHTSYVQRSKTVMYENLLHGRVLLPKDKDGDYLWAVCPIVTKNKYLLCLRFHNAQHLFGFDMVPNMIEAHVEGTEANLRQRIAWTKEYGEVPETFNPVKATPASSLKALTLDDLINGMEIEKKDEALDEMRLVLEKYMKGEDTTRDFIPEGKEDLPREMDTTKTGKDNDDGEEPQNVVEYVPDMEDRSEDSEDADGYGYTKTDVDAGGHDVEVDNHSFFAYGEYKPSNWFVNGVMTLGFGRYDETKTPLGLPLQVKYNAKSFAANVTTGYVFENGMTPEVGLRFLTSKQNSYNDGVQEVSSDRTNVLTGTAGVRFSTSCENGQWTFKPNMRMAANYDFVSDNTESNVHVIGGGDYLFVSKHQERFGLEAGLGVDATYGDWQLSLNYKGEFRKNFNSHVGMFKAKYNF